MNNFKSWAAWMIIYIALGLGLWPADEKEWSEPAPTNSYDDK